MLETKNVKKSKSYRVYYEATHEDWFSIDTEMTKDELRKATENFEMDIEPSDYQSLPKKIKVTKIKVTKE